MCIRDRLPRLTEILLNPRCRKTGGCEAVRQPDTEQCGDIRPLKGHRIIAHECIAAVTMDHEQAFPAPQIYHMQIPAKAPVRLCAVVGRFHFQESLQGEGQSQFLSLIHISWSAALFATCMSMIA